MSQINPTTAMELVANVWPVVDELTGFVHRFFVRAYAMEAADEVISPTLTALAPTDYLTAKVFAIPKTCQVVTSHGPLEACLSIGNFHLHQTEILEPAFRALEQDFARLQGISMVSGSPVGVGVIPRFPAEPYLVVTTLLETQDGRLLHQLPRQQP